MYYQVPWDTLDYEGVVPSEFACSSACVQTAEQQGVPGTCAGYAYKPAIAGQPSSCAVYYGIVPDPPLIPNMVGGAPTASTMGNMISFFANPKDPESARVPVFNDMFYTCHVYSPPPPSPPPPAREWPNGACRPNAQQCPGALKSRSEAGGDYCTPSSHGWDVSAKRDDWSCSCCSGDEAECGGTASYCTGADVHQCFEYATQAGFNVSEVAGLGLASANVACAWEPAGAPSAWNGTHALSRTLYKEWPFTYSYPRQQMSGSGSTVGRPWVLQNADGSLPTVQTKCDVEPDPANGYVASPDNCARCPFLFDEACTRYLGNPYAWPGLEPNPMGGADWASAEYRAWVQNSAGYFDDPGHTILNDGVVAETILPNNTVLTGISEHWLEQHPTKVEVTDQDHPDGAGHLYAYSPTIAPILLDLGSPQRIQEIQISYVRQGVLDGSDTVTNNAQLVGNDFTAYTNPTSMIVAGTNDPALFDAATINIERSGKVMGDELYYNRVVGGVDGSRSGACNVPPGAVCVCVGNTKVAMFPQYEPGVYATNHTVSIHTGAEGASDYRPEWPAVQYIQVMMVWPGYPCTPLLDTGAETLDGKFIQVHCGGIALSEIKVFVDDDRQPFDVTWVDANYYGGGGSGTPACTEPHLETYDQGDGAGTVVTQVPAGTEPPYVPPSDGACANNPNPTLSNCQYECSSTLNSTNWHEDGRYTGYISCPETCGKLGGFAVGARCQNAVYHNAGYEKSNQAWTSMGYDRDCASLFQRLLDPSCDYVDSKYRDGTMLVPSCILDDPLVNPNGLNDCVTGICYDDTSSSQYCNALEASQPGACSTYVQCQCIVPNEDWRPPSPPPPVDCSGLIPDGGRCGEDVPGAGICRHCCGATGFCGSSGLYCDADKGNQIGYSLQLINPYECPDSPPPAPPPGAPPPKVVKECCEEIPGVRPAKCCVYPAGEPQPIPCCADRCGAENVCPSLLPPDAGGAAARRLGDVYRRDAP